MSVWCSVAVVAWTATGLDAQSLSDAAKRAEEQRRQHAGQEVQVLAAPLPAEDETDPTLTRDLVVRYGRARLTLADLRTRDKAVQARLVDATKGIYYEMEFADILAAEPAVVTLLASLRLTPVLYVSVDKILRQMMDRRRSPRMYRDPTPRDLEHFRFVSANASFVEGLMRQCDTHEKGLRLWWGAGPTWW
jgi:hypothetical protein